MVLDLHMPGMDGFKVLRSLQSSVRPVPAIVITGHDAEDSAARLERGAFAFLRKPVHGTDPIGAITRAVAGRNEY